ncbi:hypothetical protein [Pendulispora albinea]|uniref:Uncharacterized protein n=1 Tax=Pendulispora albinea TaxID=2741071 RepID=A0ABZ2M214_9BACT
MKGLLLLGKGLAREPASKGASDEEALEDEYLQMAYEALNKKDPKAFAKHMKSAIRECLGKYQNEEE